MTPGRWMLLLLLSLLWGSSFFFQAISLESLPVVTTVFGRCAIAGVLLFVVALLLGESIPREKRTIQSIALLGVLRIAFPMLCIVWAQTRIDSNVAGLLNSTSVIFTAVVAHFLTVDDRLTRGKLVGISIAMAGVVLLMGFDAIRGLSEQVVGQIAMLCATLSYGFAAVVGSRIKNTPHTVAAAGMLIIGAALILPIAVVVDWPLTQTVSLRSGFALLCVATLSTAVAFVVWLKLIQSAGPSNTAMVTLLIPPVSLALGFWFLDEPVTPGNLAGLALILTGLVVTQWRGRGPATR